MERNEEALSLSTMEGGSVKIAPDVVAVVAGMAATEVPGVSGMSGGIVDGIAQIVRRRNLQKGVRVEVGEKETAIDLFLIVDYGARIPDVARKVQEGVKLQVERMTGLKVVEVNIHVQGVDFPIEQQQQQEEEGTPAPARVR